jgi:hypothetical protein
LSAGIEPRTQAKIEVQLNNRCFFLKRVFGGAKPPLAVLPWCKFKSMPEAWAKAKEITLFDQALDSTRT